MPDRELDLRVCSAVSPDAVVAREFTGTLGGSLVIPCDYNKGYESNAKYWCRGADGSCVKVPEAGVGRVSIKDHTGERRFTVTMERLRQEDAGSYQCGIDISLAKDLLFSLTVIQISDTPTAGPTTFQPTTISPNTTFFLADKTSSMTNYTSTNYTSTYASANVFSTSVNQPFTEGQSDWVLMYLLPVLGALLLLFLLIAVVFIRVKKKRKSAYVRDSSETKDAMHLSQMPPDLPESPSYAVLNFCPNASQAGVPNTAHPSNSASQEVCYAKVKGLTQPCTGMMGAQSTVGAEAEADSVAPQHGVYANVQLLREDPSPECQYSTVNA